MELTGAIITGLVAGIYFNISIIYSEVKKIRKNLEEREWTRGKKMKGTVST